MRGAVDANGRYLLAGGKPSNFTLEETACRCGCGLRFVSQEVIELAQELRNAFGVLHVNSGVRCRAHNKAVGGAQNSKHLPDDSYVGHALDLTPRFYSPAVVAAEFRRRYPDRHGCKAYGSFVHIDDRPEMASW